MNNSKLRLEIRNQIESTCRGGTRPLRRNELEYLYRELMNEPPDPKWNCGKLRYRISEVVGGNRTPFHGSADFRKHTLRQIVHRL